MYLKECSSFIGKMLNMYQKNMQCVHRNIQNLFKKQTCNLKNKKKSYKNRNEKTQKKKLRWAGPADAPAGTGLQKQQ